MTDLVAPVQIVVDTEKLLQQIGWSHFGYDSDGDPTEDISPVDLHRDLAFQVARILAPQLEKEMRSVVRDVVAEVARDRVAVVIDEVFAAGFRKTNGYGEPIGEPVTLRQMVIGEVEGQLARKVTANGNSARGYDSGAMSYAEYVAANAAKEALRGELGAAVTAAVDEVKGRVTGLVAEELGAKIAKAVTR